VWKETKELGIAKAKGDDGKIFVVARYHPAGNYMNQFQDNVKPKVDVCHLKVHYSALHVSLIAEKGGA